MYAELERILERLFDPITLFSVVFSAVIVTLGLLVLAVNPKLVRLILKNLRRNLLRTGLTTVAIMVLVVMVTMIWTVVFFLDRVTREQSENVKLIVTERWQLPSMLPGTHADYLDPRNSRFLSGLVGLYGPNDFMTWSFYGGTLDPTKMTRENMVFFFCMDADHIKPMMDDLDKLDDALIEKMKYNRQGVLLGTDRMQQINKKVGETFKVTSFNYKGIDLEFEIVGELPEGRWNLSGIMNVEYFTQALDDYKQRNRGTAHPMDLKRLNLIWLRVRDQKTFSEVARIIEEAPEFADRPIKCEAASSGFAAFLDAYRDLLWGMKWLMVPAILISMALIVANAIAITVRERYTEMAVLKVLGFKPRQIQILVLGEALLVGGLAGFLAGGLTWSIVNLVYGGIKFPIAFFPAFTIPWEAFFWGSAMGLGTGLLGSFLPALSARSVKVSEVFSRVG